MRPLLAPLLLWSGLASAPLARAACPDVTDPQCPQYVDPCRPFPKDQAACRQVEGACRGQGAVAFLQCVASGMLALGISPAPPPPPGAPLGGVPPPPGLPPAPPPPPPPITSQCTHPPSPKPPGWDELYKCNESLFQEQAVEKDQFHLNPLGEGRLFVTQDEAFLGQDNVYGGCIVTNVSGRSDGLCTIDPNDPICTGMALSLSYATNCAVSGPAPPGGGPAPCLQRGAFGYDDSEWLLFGAQYYTGMSGCLGVKEGSDGTGARRSRMTQLNDFASFPADPDSGAALSGSPQSTITGKPKKDKLPSASSDPLWKRLAQSIDDGAAYLGYERGELFRRASEGESFSAAFAGSPYAEKLGADPRQQLQDALDSPGDRLEKAAEKRQARIEQSGKAEEYAEAEARAAKPGGNALSSLLRKKKGLGASELLAAVGASASPATPLSPESTQSRELASARALLGEDAPQRKRWGAGTAALRGSAALESPGALPEEASLFQRIHLSYRKRAQAMRAYGESSTARDVRNTETPQFFKDL